MFKVNGERPRGAVAGDRADPAPRRARRHALAPERVEARLQKFFPKSGRYPVEYVNVYGVSQRVAATFRRGRVLLAGDSAHVNNPIGGMGMNGGIHDAVNLADKLARVLHGEADETSARPLHAPAPSRGGRVRPGADHRQQEADGRARSAGARRKPRRAASHRGGSRGGSALHAPRRAARQPQFRECGEVNEGPREHTSPSFRGRPQVGTRNPDACEQGWIPGSVLRTAPE